MSALAHLFERNIQVSVTQNGGLNLKGLSVLSDDARQDVVSFARQNKQAIISELKTPSPDSSRIHPAHRAEYTRLWYQACELEDYTSGDAPYSERIARMPELNGLVERMSEIESIPCAKIHQDQAGVNGRHKQIPGIPEDNFQAPVAYLPGDSTLGAPGTCPACGKRQWWRLNSDESKWICGRCHPPAAGLAVAWMDAV